MSFNNIEFDVPSSSISKRATGVFVPMPKSPPFINESPPSISLIWLPTSNLPNEPVEVAEPLIFVAETVSLTFAPVTSLTWNSSVLPAYPSKTVPALSAICKLTPASPDSNFATPFTEVVFTWSPWLTLGIEVPTPNTLPFHIKLDSASNSLVVAPIVTSLFSVALFIADTGKLLISLPSPNIFPNEPVEVAEPLIVPSNSKPSVNAPLIWLANCADPLINVFSNSASAVCNLDDKLLDTESKAPLICVAIWAEPLIKVSSNSVSAVVILEEKDALSVFKFVTLVEKLPESAFKFVTLVEKLPESDLRFVTLVEKLPESVCKASILSSSVVSLVETLALSATRFVPKIFPLELICEEAVMGKGIVTLVPSSVILPDSILPFDWAITILLSVKLEVESCKGILNSEPDCPATQ